MSLRDQLVCTCRCHEDETGGPGVVTVSDPVGAVTACSRCLNWHSPALRCELPELEAWRPPRRETSRWVDSDGAGMPGD